MTDELIRRIDALEARLQDVEAKVAGAGAPQDDGPHVVSELGWEDQYGRESRWQSPRGSVAPNRAAAKMLIAERQAEKSASGDTVQWRIRELFGNERQFRAEGYEAWEEV